MSFRLRLALFFVAALAGVQVLTAVLVYQVTRNELIEAGQRQLDVAAHAFAGQLDAISERVAESVRVLSLDYALRSAIAQHDKATVLSALRNHGLRVGATQMLLVGIDGRVEADTLEQFSAGSPFPYSDLADKALEGPAAAVVAWEGNAYWMVVVPVYAPNLIALIAAAIPVDDRLLAQLQQQSALPKSIELATLDTDGRWVVIAHGSAPVRLTRQLAASSHALPELPEVVDIAGREFVVQAITLSGARQSAPVAAVMGFSVDAALSPYRSVAAAWAGLLAFGLLVGLVFAWLIARGVSRPVEELAASARRIQAGDYDPPPTIARGDEIGELTMAFSSMAESIREREARILFQAGHDQVTGLPNRLAAEARIQDELIARPGQSSALLMVGLGRIPEIIKTMGHAVCDRLMRDVGERIGVLAGHGQVARATDTQFSIFLPTMAQSDATAMAYRIVNVLGEPYREAGLTLDLAPAVGVAVSPKHGTEASVLLRRAQVALIGVLGMDDPVAVYDGVTDPHRPERLSLMGDLRDALDHRQIELYYQPKLDLSSGDIDGAEALARWKHPVRGMLMPDTFIVLAEETGNIRRLTHWALATGIEQAGHWMDDGLLLRVSINVSAHDLGDADLPRRVADLLARHGVAPERIVLEITESAIMKKPDTAIATLGRLVEIGIDLAIDDFGVGQSSLAYLRRLPALELKIDKTFIMQLARNREDQAIVRSIVELGHQLGHRVTAEGVDESAVLDYLTRIGCDHAQGYLIAKPLARADFERFFEARRDVTGETM